MEDFAGLQHAEQVFRGLRGGHWAGWHSMFRWTTSKILVHALPCMPGLSMLRYLLRKA